MDSSNFVGCVVYSKFQYYDSPSNEMKFKARPFLIVKAEKEDTPCDFTVLPVSRIQRAEHIHPEYDYFVSSSVFPKARLSCDSYIRTHKISAVNGSEFSYEVNSFFKKYYPENYQEVVALTKKYIQEIV